MDNNDPESTRGELEPIKLSREDLVEVSDDLYMKMLDDAQKWDVDTRVLAATYYCILGSGYKVERYMKAANRPVPARTIYHWRTKPWWKELTAEIKRAKGDEFDALATKVIHKSYEEIYDRLEHGDHHTVRRLDKETGEETVETVRVPVKARDIVTIAGITYDKRALQRGDPTSKVSRDSPEENLQKLADFFSNMTKTGETIDAKKVVETEYSEVNEQENENAKR